MKRDVLRCRRLESVDDNAPIMAARWTAWIVWAALAASLVFWGLRLSGRSAPVPAHAETVVMGQAVQGDVLRLFAATRAASQPMAAAPEAAARFKVLGVAAPSGRSSLGWALLSIDGQPPRAVAVGAAVDAGWILQSVTQSRVEIGPKGGAAAVALDLALPPPAATGTLASAGEVAGTAGKVAGVPMDAGLAPAGGVAPPPPGRRTLGAMVGAPPPVPLGQGLPPPGQTPADGVVVATEPPRDNPGAIARD
jgi:general secretion pathway protein C